MAHPQDIDLEVRGRLRAWLRWLKDSRDLTNEKTAETLHLSEPTVTNILNGRRTAGLDVFLHLHRFASVRLDELVYGWPPAIPGKPNPFVAPSSAQPAGQRRAGQH